MELLHETLANALKRKKCSGGLTKSEAWKISIDIASGLDFLHGHDPPLVHRDLSAKNILLTEDGTAKISDLGVSKFRPTDLGYLSTRAPGCPLYMPPEALGKDPKYTEKLDMFSFGVVMLQMVTGKKPNPDIQGIGVVPEVERRKDHIELVPNEHVLKKGILQCLEDDPSKRPSAKKIALLFFESCKAPNGFRPQFEPLSVVFLHGMGTGTSGLVFHYSHGHFNGHTTPTMGLALNTVTYADTHFYLWDTSDHEQYADTDVKLCRAIHGVAVVVDVTNMRSLEDARARMQVVDIHFRRLPTILLANKCDLVVKRTVTAETLSELAEELQCFAYVGVSAKTGQNVKEAFHMLFDKILAVEWMKSQTVMKHQISE